VFGGFEEGEFDIAKQLIVIADECEIHFDTLVHSRISEACGDPITVGFVGNLFADRRQIMLAIGILDVCQELGPFAHPGEAAPEQVAGRPHRRGLDRRLGPQAATQRRGTRVGSARVVCGLAPGEGVHGAGLPQHAGQARVRPEVGRPGPT
jgi:hypothetical protein